MPNDIVNLVEDVKCLLALFNKSIIECCNRLISSNVDVLAKRFISHFCCILLSKYASIVVFSFNICIYIYTLQLDIIQAQVEFCLRIPRAPKFEPRKHTGLAIILVSNHFTSSWSYPVRSFVFIYTNAVQIVFVR